MEKVYKWWGNRLNIYEIKCTDDDGIVTTMSVDSDMNDVEDLEFVLERLFKFFIKTGAVLPEELEDYFEDL